MLIRFCYLFSLNHGMLSYLVDSRNNGCTLFILGFRGSSIRFGEQSVPDALFSLITFDTFFFFDEGL